MPTALKLPKKKSVGNKSNQNTNRSNRLIKTVTFFGDAAIPESDPTYKAVYEAASLLAENGYGVVNGGGPGVMKAATDGAEAVSGHTVGVYWEPKLAAVFEGKNLANVTDESEASANYVMRTLGLIERGDAYVVCKGGTGTISEFGMVWALSKLYYGSHKPVILFGEFWDPLITAVQENMNIDEIELSVLYQVTTPEEILEVLEHHEQRIASSVSRPESAGDEWAFMLGTSGTFSNSNATPDIAVKSEVHKGPHSANPVPKGNSTKKYYDQLASAYHVQHAGKLVAQDQLEEFVKLVNPPAKVLDVGTGPGYDAAFLSEKYKVVGIEPSQRFVEIAKFENPTLEIFQADIVDFPLPENTYKGIWARDSLHHIPGKYLKSVFSKLAASMVAGGVLYLIAREGQGEITEEVNMEGRLFEKFFHLFNAEELTSLAGQAGLEIVKIDHSKRSHDWILGVFSKPDEQAWRSKVSLGNH